MKMYGYGENHFEPQLKSIKVLWRFCIFYLVINSYLIGYTVISFLQANILVGVNDKDEPKKICNVITENIEYDTILWAIKRIVEFNLWQVPVIILMWPRKIKVTLEGDPVRFDSQFNPLVVRNQSKSTVISISTAINDSMLKSTYAGT
jgi:hypothetical protein